MLNGVFLSWAGEDWTRFKKVLDLLNKKKEKADVPIHVQKKKK